ncbi:MAG: hypothetical protein VKK04_22495 [Synechococcales bacterium]|nr:hypothetical protein [Synechococcales bacterium]
MKNLSTAFLIVLGVSAYYASLHGQPPQVVAVGDRPAEKPHFTKLLPYVVSDRPSKTLTTADFPTFPSPSSDPASASLATCTPPANSL